MRITAPTFASAASSYQSACSRSWARGWKSRECLKESSVAPNRLDSRRRMLCARGGAPYGESIAKRISKQDTIRISSRSLRSDSKGEEGIASEAARHCTRRRPRIRKVDVDASFDCSTGRRTLREPSASRRYGRRVRQNLHRSADSARGALDQRVRSVV